MGDKGSGGVETYNYFGTLLAGICAGPVDQLHAVIVDGKSIVDCDPPVERGANPYTVITSLVEEKYLHGSGQMIIYWGTDTTDLSAQFSSGVFDHHPDYRGMALLAVSGLLFGRERTMAPNIEVIVSRLPLADTSLVAAEDNIFDDGQVNPVAAIVDIMTGWHGLGLPVAAFHASDWLHAAEYCAADPDRFFCSPLLTQQSDASRTISEMLAIFDGAIYWTAAGLIGLRLIEPGVDPGGLSTLDAAHWTERARIEGVGWTDVPTGVVVRFPDRDHAFKEREARIANLVALRARGQTKSMVVDRQHFTRSDQATLVAAELVRRTSRPPGKINLTVRRYHASGLGPGSKVLVDTDPEPGGAGLAQLCVVQTRIDNATGPTKLTLVPDTLVDATPYSPAFTAPSPQAADCPGIVAADSLAIPLPPSIWGLGRIGILAPRPGNAVIGFRVFFAVDTDSDNNLDEEDWADLGVQPGFAVQMTLDEDVDEDETEIELTLTEGATGVDAYLAGRLPDNERDAEQDPLLLILANLDSGEVAIGPGWVPEMEVCSIVTRAAVDTDTHTYTVLRARRGTSARAWLTSGSPAAYIIPLANLLAWNHPQIQGLLGGGGRGYLRLVAFTADVEDDGTRPQISFTFPISYNPAPAIAWDAPADGSPDYGQGTADPSTGSYTPDVTITDPEGDLVAVEITSRKTDGTGYVLHHAVTLEPTASYTFNAALTFTDGSHTLTVTARDKAGNVSTSSRTVAKTAVGGMAPPTFDPPSGTLFTTTRTVQITVTSPADQVQWVVTTLGAGEPASWPDTTTAGTLTKMVSLTSSKRVWARARKSVDGTTSAAAFGDYEKFNLN